MNINSSYRKWLWISAVNPLGCISALPNALILHWLVAIICFSTGLSSPQCSPYPGVAQEELLLPLNYLLLTAPTKNNIVTIIFACFTAENMYFKNTAGVYRNYQPNSSIATLKTIRKKNLRIKHEYLSVGRIPEVHKYPPTMSACNTKWGHALPTPIYYWA